MRPEHPFLPASILTLIARARRRSSRESKFRRRAVESASQRSPAPSGSLTLPSEPGAGLETRHGGLGILARVLEAKATSRFFCRYGWRRTGKLQTEATGLFARNEWVSLNVKMINRCHTIAHRPQEKNSRASSTNTLTVVSNCLGITAADCTSVRSRWRQVPQLSL